MKKMLILSIFICQFSIAFADTLWLSKDIYLIKITEHCYVHTSYFTDSTYGRFGSNGMIVVNEKRAALFDTPMTDSLTRKLVNYIQDSLSCKIEYFVPNHFHNDCTEGMDIIDSLKIKTISSEKTAEISKEKGIIQASKTFKDTAQLKLGDILIVCDYLGAGHAPDNIVCYVGKDKVLFGGCMVRSMETQSAGNLSDANFSDWPKTINKIQKKYKKTKYVIPGHGNYGSKKLLEHTVEILETISKF